MSSKPSEVSCSMLGLRGQVAKEDPPKPPRMSLLPRSSVWLLENGFVTPKSRGRSAANSMARTPYSRPKSTVKVSTLSHIWFYCQVATCSSQFYNLLCLQIGSLLPSSQSTLEESLPSGSTQGDQKVIFV